EGEARIRFPSGEVVMGDAPGIDRLLSRALEQPVALVREQETSHMDAAAIHMITSASLAWARRELPEANWDVRRFRPNLVIS
ncbi:MAG: MOSC domain-containing protein, partial [Akkermansiaceae bacterium]|nr:MOSC domain-containing protein [Akkermansiaceae bacterium]